MYAAKRNGSVCVLDFMILTGGKIAIVTTAFYLRELIEEK